MGRSEVSWTERFRSPRSRLSIRGRARDDDFSPAERLFVRGELVDGKIAANSLENAYPSTGGMSMNRSRYSIPRDILFPNWKNREIFSMTVATCPTVTKDGHDLRWNLWLQHDPQGGAQENHSHTLLCTSATGGREPKKIPGGVRTNVRLSLSGVLEHVPKHVPRRAIWATGMSVLAIISVIAGSQIDLTDVPVVDGVKPAGVLAQIDAPSSSENADPTITVAQIERDSTPLADPPPHLPTPAWKRLAAGPSSPVLAHSRDRSGAQDHWDRGVVPFKAGDFEEALVHFERSVRADDSFVVGLNSLARTHAELGNRSDSRSTYVRALNVSPTYVPSLVGLAVLMSHDGYREEALELCRRALEENPEHKEAIQYCRNIRLRSNKKNGQADTPSR